MFKLITLVVGLAIGFGGGVWFGQKNPDMAAKFSKEEQRQVIEKALALNAQIKAKLEQMQGKSSTPGSGFVSSGSAGGADVKEVKAEADKQEAELQAQLTKLK
jgi:hypothetical protein